MKLNKRQTKMWHVLLFIVKFIAFVIPVYLILWLGVDLTPFQQMVTDHSVLLAQATGMRVFEAGTNIGVYTLNGFRWINISADCTGWKSMLAFLALVMATPALLRKKLNGLLIGLPIIYIANLIRVVSVVWIAAFHGLDAAETAHVYSWRIGLTIVLFVLWVIWLNASKIFISSPKKIRLGSHGRHRVSR